MRVHMRRLFLSMLIVTVAMALGWLSVAALSRVRGAQEIPPSDLLRFHVLANSDASRDQAVKNLVRDAVLEKTADLFRTVTTAGQARAVASRNLEVIVGAANSVLAQAGEEYRATAVVGEFDFPIKRYGDLVLPAGQYSAVRVLLGDAQGQNWWCVLFPPLCFKDFDSGFAISSVRKVSARKTLASYGKSVVGRLPKAHFRFTLRGLERQDNPAGAHLVWRKKDAKRK